MPPIRQVVYVISIGGLPFLRLLREKRKSFGCKLPVVVRGEPVIESE